MDDTPILFSLDDSIVIEKVRRMDCASVVPGDVLLLESGMSIPADVCLLEKSDDFQVDLSMFFVSTQSPILLQDFNCPDHNHELVCWMGTQVIQGSAKARALRTGNKTLWGQLLLQQKWPLVGIHDKEEEFECLMMKPGLV